MGAEIITLGCRLNIAESETIRTILAESAADIVVVNSCAVTNRAVSDTRRAIRRARRDAPGKQIVVTGCAAQIDPNGFAAMPEVDRVIGNLEKLSAAAWRSEARTMVGDIMNAAGAAPAPRPVFGAHARGFVQIQNGCDHRCTFCTIPFGRGPNRSVPAGAVVEAVAALAAAGHREVVLTGVDVTSYGSDLPGQPRLASLVGRVLRFVPGLARLRLSSLDPAGVDDALFELLVGESRIMPHVHLSMQAGDDMILKRMRRRHDRRQAMTLVERLKRGRPRIAIGADLIAGFPTEDDAMFERTRSLIDDCVIVHAHVFPYSPRAGTPAARMPQVDFQHARDRARALRSTAADQRSRWLRDQIGTTALLLVEHPGDRGHIDNFAEARIEHAEPAGSIVSVEVVKVVDGQLGVRRCRTGREPELECIT